MLEARCLQSCSTYTGIKGAYSFSCCGSIFDVGERYKLELLNDININSHGEVELYFSARVWDGSRDGYDDLCGVRFESAQWFNNYFQVVSDEDNQD